MKRVTLISVALASATLWLAGCQREPIVQPVAKSDKTIPSYHVPREKALAELNAFLADVDADNITRGGKVRQIKEVMPILGDKFSNTTRVSEDEAAAAIDTLLYMVNFEDEEGYAVLSAVDFLAPIIAVMDEGNADSTLIDQITDPDHFVVIEEDDCGIDYYEDELAEEGIDTTNWGVIINPIIPTGPTNNSTALTRSSETVNAIDNKLKFVLHTLNDYCEFMLIERNDNNPEGNGGGSNNGSGGASGDDGGNTQTPQDAIIISQVQPMLQTIWHQLADFNELCPQALTYTVANGGHKPVGCSAIALGQVIAYNKYPLSLGAAYIPNWNIISQVTSESTPTEIFHVAKLLARLGDNEYIDIDYQETKSSATMNRVKRAMIALGYENVSKFCGYRESEIIAYLNTNKPFIIGATSPKNLSGDGKKHGHAWVIDGYIKRLRNNQVETMMHCNMGWDGLYDGYYASGIFDTTKITDENGETINITATDSNKRKYCKYYRSIRYDKPNTFN